MAQCDSDVERRMWVKGNLGRINNSGMKIAKGGGNKLWAMQRVMHRDPEFRGPESNNVSKLSTKVVFSPLWPCLLHHELKGTEMISLSVKCSDKVHIPALIDKVQ